MRVCSGGVPLIYAVGCVCLSPNCAFNLLLRILFVHLIKNLYKSSNNKTCFLHGIFESTLCLEGINVESSLMTSFQIADDGNLKVI